MFLDDADLDVRIRRLRKGNFTVKFVDAEGTAPPAGTKIAYRMTRLGFDLGTVLYWSIFKRPEIDIDRRNYLEKINGYFNTVVIPIFWHRMEPEQGKPDADTPLQIWQWCHDHRKATLGHAIFYGWDGPDDIDPADASKDLNFIQPWVRGLGKQGLEKAMKARLQRVLSLFDGKISDFVLSNELLNPKDYYLRVLGFENGAPYFKWAKATAPNATFYVNENGGILTGDKAEKYAEMMCVLIEAGAEVGAIGIQGHFFGDTVPQNEELWSRLDMLSEFGLPIKMTEFGVRTKDEEQYAEDMQRFYRLCFGHPSVTGIIRWGIWEPEMWPHVGVPIPEAPLWRKDWSNTPAGEAYVKLVTNEWNTLGIGELDQEGGLRFHGFFGTYQLTMMDGREYVIEFTPSVTNVTLRIDCVR